MTNAQPTADDRETLRVAAAAHSAAARDVEAFLRRLPEVPGPADVTEYATLLSREKRARGDLQAAADAVGLKIGSMESE
ncbi:MULTISPECIES: hypothetical protein [unclassified Micromonospora]|uniref:hypothetical protein n=1 Tax=unclassified Micromonospora TaxID=2617518 RepID=UPI0036307C70